MIRGRKKVSNRNSIMIYTYIYTHTRILSDREQKFSRNRVRKSFPREIDAARRGLLSC